MPETSFVSRWPDGSVLISYSPSLVVHDHLEAGTSYPVDDFVRRSTVALQAASERVRERYGYPCGRAMASLVEIELRAADQVEGSVSVEQLQPDRAPA